MAKFNTNFSRSVYGMLLVLIVLGIYVNTVESTFPYPEEYVKYGDTAFSTMESKVSGLPGRTAPGEDPPSSSSSDFFKQIDNLIRQRSFVGNPFVFNGIALTAGTFSNLKSYGSVEWANVTRAYFGSYVEKVPTTQGCALYEIGVNATTKPVVILAPVNLDATAYIESLDMKNGKINICFYGMGDTMVWVIPKEKNLVYNQTGEIVGDVATSERGVEYTAGHVTTSMDGGCLVVPFGFDMQFVPFTFASIESDKNYTVWVQDASTDGFVVCYRPKDDLTDSIAKEITVHYVAVTNFQHKDETDDKFCFVAVSATQETEPLIGNFDATELDAYVQLFSRVADTSKGYARLIARNGEYLLLDLENRPNCQVLDPTLYTILEKEFRTVGVEDAITVITSDPAFIEFLEIFENHMPKEIIDYVSTLKNVAVVTDATRLSELTAEIYLNADQIIVNAIPHPPCEPKGYVEVDGVWKSEYLGFGCADAVEIPVLANDYSYSEIAAYITPAGKAASATDLTKHASLASGILHTVISKEPPQTGAGFEIPGVLPSGILLLLLSLLIATV